MRTMQCNAKNAATLVFALLGCTVLTNYAYAVGTESTNAEKLESVKCPVMGNPINLAVSTATDDGPVYFCCAGCIGRYEKDAKKYADKVSEQRKALKALDKVQVACPITGEAISEKSFIEEGGKKVYFCCNGCIKKYTKAPEKYAAKLANSYTYQTQCPVMGEDIDPNASVTLTNGMSVYLCCKGCIKKLSKDLAKYAPKLADQGYSFDADKVHVEGAGKSGGHGHDGDHDHDHDHDHGDG